MVEVLLRRTIGGLTPDADGEALPLLQRIPVGSVVAADIKDPRRRSSAYHNFFFALLSKVWANQDYFKTVDQLRHALLVRLGYVETVRLKGGREFVFPKSMKFSKMGREESDKFMAEAIKFICEEVLPGLPEGALRREIEEMIGAPLPPPAAA